MLDDLYRPRVYPDVVGCGSLGNLKCAGFVWNTSYSIREPVGARRNICEVVQDEMEGNILVWPEGDVLDPKDIGIRVGDHREIFVVAAFVCHLPSQKLFDLYRGLLFHRF